MLLVYNIFLSRLKISEFLILVALSTLLGLSGTLDIDKSKMFPFWELYVIWQTGMAFALEWVLDRKVENENVTAI